MAKTDLIKKGWRIYHNITVVIVIASIIALIILFITTISQPQQSNNNAAKQQTKTIECGITPNELLFKAPDQTDFKTITEIASIDYDTEVTTGSFKKNDIPALNKPLFTDYEEMDRCLADDSLVVAVEAGGKVKLYSKEVLAYHFAVNDVIGDEQLLITYSPLSGFYEVYKRGYKDETLTFGVSGKLYKQNDLLFDIRTESFWSQFDGVARVGTLTGGKLEKYPFRLMDYANAKKLYPNAQVISFDTGYRINYLYDISQEFLTTLSVLGEKRVTSGSFSPTTEVVGFIVNNKQYALDTVNFKDNQTYTTKVDGKSLRIKKVGGELLAYLGSEVTQANLELRLSYWYIWESFYPETKTL